MRLLRLEDDGEFSPAEYYGKDIPQYAILSHTWGADHEEVTYKDLAAGRGKDKVGYRKLTFCAKQAARDGLQFFWIDTCCIDKSSSAELSEAINSMFRWYQESAKCYVYLSDVTLFGDTGNDLSSLRSWEPSFQGSRWFTRGWTLQELIAPTSVEFFSADGEPLGSRDSLAHQIQEITGICAQALQGQPLSQFGVDERMSWAKDRETKREEDAAYSLLGIFEVSMPAIYGEGKHSAFRQLWKKIKEKSSDDGHASPQGHLNEPHCDRCGKQGHLNHDVHCYKCGEYGHFAREPHCSRCKSHDHLASDCTKWMTPAAISDRAARRLIELRQERSACEYATEFEKIASQLKWDDRTLVDFFDQGLKYHVRRELRLKKDRPETLSEYISQAVKIDDWVYKLSKPPRRKQPYRERK